MDQNSFLDRHPYLKELIAKQRKPKQRDLHSLYEDLVGKHGKGSKKPYGPWRCATPQAMHEGGRLTEVRLKMACGKTLSAANYTAVIPPHSKRCAVCAPVR